MTKNDVPVPEPSRLLILQVALLIVLNVGMLLTMLALAIDRIEAAPLPLPRPTLPRPPDLVKRFEVQDLSGPWHLDWGGSKWHLDLSPFGTYRCWMDGGEGEWQGTWQIDPRDTRLYVVERHVDVNGVGNWGAWYVEWNKDADGKMSRSVPAGEAMWGEDDRPYATVRMVRPPTKVKK